MKLKKLKLPPELESFIEAGNTTLSCEDGDWDLHIVPREESPFRNELPSRSIMIAENGCGDCLFLKTSPGRKVGHKVFVFWHEEDRCEGFANHVKELTTPFDRSAGTAESSGQVPTMLVSELEAALNSSDLKIRDDAMRQFAKTAFGIDALPVLRKALDDDWVEVVLTAAECIGKLGPQAAACPAGQAETGSEGVKLEWQLMLVGSKVWSYSMYANCYSTCLNALVKLEVDSDGLVEFVQGHIGLGPDDLIDSLNALKAVGSPEALSILKRAAAFWLPELNMKYAKQVQKILETAGAQKRRA